MWSFCFLLWLQFSSIPGAICPQPATERVEPTRAKEEQRDVESMKEDNRACVKGQSRAAREGTAVSGERETDALACSSLPSLHPFLASHISLPFLSPSRSPFCACHRQHARTVRSLLLSMLFSFFFLPSCSRRDTDPGKHNQALCAESAVSASCGHSHLFALLAILECKKAAHVLREFTMPGAKTGPDKLIPKVRHWARPLEHVLAYFFFLLFSFIFFVFLPLLSFSCASFVVFFFRCHPLVSLPSFDRSQCVIFNSLLT